MEVEGAKMATSEDVRETLNVLQIKEDLGEVQWQPWTSSDEEGEEEATPS